MKRKLSPSQELNQENIQERSNQRRSSIPHHQPTPPPPQPQPINETNQQDHEATLDLNTCLSPIPQTMPLANASSCPTNTLDHQPSESVLPSHATPRIYHHSQEMHQESSTALLPRTACFSSTSGSVCMPLPAINMSSLRQPQSPYVTLSRPNISSERGPVIRPISPRLQLVTREQLLMLLQSPPSPPSTPDAGSSIAAANQNEPHENDSEPIIAPYRWATTRQATVHPFAILKRQGINRIDGWMECKHCKKTYELHYNLQEKFTVVASIIIEHKNTTDGMAPIRWERPTVPNCTSCGNEQCVKPIIEVLDSSDINWLFLLLGQWIGYCSPKQLKYFCKHNGYSQEGCKLQLIYRTFIGLCQQLLPEAHFDSLI